MKIDEVSEIMEKGFTVTHTHLGITADYRISACITRFSKENGWFYQLELKDLNANSITIASLEDVQKREDK